MIRTAFFYIYFWVFLVLTIPLYFPYFILRILKQEMVIQAFINTFCTLWARSIIKCAGGRIIVKGLDNVPKENRICFIANHQGALDIPIIVGYIPKTVGFIAKSELLYIPIFSSWMKAVHCIFINRSKKRQAVKVIQQGVEQIKQGHPMAIFPEGTRSRGNRINLFKKGSLKLALRSNALIVPVTIDGSYKLREANGGLISPASVKLTIHKPIESEKLTEEEKKNLSQKLWEIINSAMEKKSEMPG